MIYPPPGTLKCWKIFWAKILTQNTEGTTREGHQRSGIFIVWWQQSATFLWEVINPITVILCYLANSLTKLWGHMSNTIWSPLTTFTMLLLLKRKQTRPVKGQDDWTLTKFKQKSNPTKRLSCLLTNVLNGKRKSPMQTWSCHYPLKLPLILADSHLIIQWAIELG